jgi:hypothetical protein
MHRKIEYSSLALEPVEFNLFRSLELAGLVTNIDKLPRSINHKPDLNHALA